MARIDYYRDPNAPAPNALVPMHERIRVRLLDFLAGGRGLVR